MKTTQLFGYFKCIWIIWACSDKFVELFVNQMVR